MKRSVVIAAAIILASVSQAQESVREFQDSGQYSKYLTPGQMDSWVFSGNKGETIIAHVATKEFDPVLELAAKADADDKVLLEVDDQGSESRFSLRLPETGEYKIRVHAFKYQGGGNYALSIQRFQAEPVEIGAAVTGTFDREGKSYHYFIAEQDHIVIPQCAGTSAASWQMLDGKGRPVSDWLGTVRIDETGEHSIIVSGRPGNRYRLLIRQAVQRNLAEADGLAGSLQQGEMDVWNFQAEPGQFRFLKMESTGQLAARLIHAPVDEDNQQRIGDGPARPALRLLPVASKGGHTRFAALAGRRDRYQLQLLAVSPATYRLESTDPTISISAGQKRPGDLPVGDAAFYSFSATPGQVFRAELASDKFDALLRLYNADGDAIDTNDDGGVGLGSRITHMVTQPGTYRLQVSSLGDGGGGEFSLTLSEEKLQELKIGQRSQGMLAPNATDFWAFTGKENQTVLINVRSTACDPVVHVRDPNGVEIGSDDNGGVGADSLLAIKLPAAGRYTIWITSKRGAGDYAVRLIDGD